MTRRAIVLLVLCLTGRHAAAQPLPFQHKVEVFRDEDGEATVFALRLEQPFLAEEFEKSNYLRLTSLDGGSYLIYPKETKFRQKHAEFYGRLRGQGKAKLRLSYEIVSENLDGTRRVDVRKADIDVAIPPEETGPRSIYRQWAQQQNQYFTSLLRYYPNETFFQYVLLQSPDRYGVAVPSLSRPMPSRTEIETELYHTFSGGLRMQQSLQRQALNGGPGVGDLEYHVSRLDPPSLLSHPYEELLEAKLKEGHEPVLHEIAKLIPADQYFLHLASMKTADELIDLFGQWGTTLFRLFTTQAVENHLQEKFQDQLCLDSGDLRRLFEDGVVAEMAVTGADIFLAEGSDVTLIFRLKKPDVFRQAADRWLADVKKRFPRVLEREFNYRGHKVAARYASDRMVSSFVVFKGDYAIFSNSHRGIRRIVDTMIGAAKNLHDSPDYRYLTTLLPPSPESTTGYLFASESFLKGLITPAFKISEKRRLQCFNNLVMLNNASLFYRLEHGESPSSLTDLVVGKFVNSDKLICPHGGAYAIDVEHDTCTCSLHNRIKYLTPNVELNVLQVSADERAQYERYKNRYGGFWRRFFNPLAVRITAAPRVKMEVAVLPFLNSSIYQDLRGWVGDDPQPIRTGGIARSALLSLVVASGRERVRRVLRSIPGIPEALEADPTLTDLSWIGDQVSVHFCDDDVILEVDPTRLRPLTLIGETSVLQQTVIATGITAASLPLYITVAVDDEDKAERLLHEISSRIFLQGGSFGGVTTALDAYRLPDYKGHEIYVLSYRLYAMKLRLHVSLVRGQLVAATRPETLREVIDASARAGAGEAREAHAMLRCNRRALKRLRGDLETYWNEKSRRACHRNIMSIYTLVKLYDTPTEDVDERSDAKYGVTYFCPDGGKYLYEKKRDQVVCSVHGNRQDARQELAPDARSSFRRFTDSFDELITSLRFTEDCLIATIEVVRGEKDL